MFGLRALFAALSRLTAAVSRSAELFETANGQLERQLGIDVTSEPASAPPAALPPNEEEKAAKRGRKAG